MSTIQLPIPEFFNRDRVPEIWRVPYQERAAQAQKWAEKHALTPAAEDLNKVCLLLIDVQNTFCHPEFELFVGGKSGRGAIEDNQRLCEFIYRNLGLITDIIPTLDTHTAMQIFHPIFWINEQGEHPTPAATTISFEDVETGKWRVNPAVAYSVSNGDYETLQKHAFYYTRELSQNSKLPLTIWPYHSMLGGIGHALVPAVEEACFFHNIARQSQTLYEAKGSHSLTENYSVLSPEVTTNETGKTIAEKNHNLIAKLLDYDTIIIAGQAKSHCVAWTVEDLLSEIKTRDSKLAEKVYLLDDCTSPVVVPDVVDYSEVAENAFQRFADAGMHRVKSTDDLP
ncbi:MAG: isochorismatase [Jaaginema sp. PMC 1079.18]|nr:isochorismatase [Jaaginema sp. PMC 1080.18]MEC4850015.1 isochorismatase [Jaaginema sp. PMC 1079.18]MEC4867455.1 isochorismatase [Jaaginema sp. PMC 1078.18]